MAIPTLLCGMKLMADDGIMERIASNQNLTVAQPDALTSRLAPQDKGETGDDAVAAPTGGYRIQVFAGNNSRTAQGTANSRAAEISAEFPQWSTYVVFKAPYWRLKVGDFPSSEEALAALSMLKKQFPAYAKEMRVVRDRIKTDH